MGDISIVNFLSLILDFSNNKLFSTSLINAEFALFSVLLMDNIWKHRNLVNHGSNCPSVQDLVTKVSVQTKEHWNSFATRCTARPPLNKPWMPPPESYFKVNTDSAFAQRKAMAGAVIKNHRGSILFAATKSDSCDDPIQAEALAILLGCTILDKLKIARAIIESDCNNAISDITMPAIAYSWKAQPIYDQIRKLWNCWPSWIFKFSPRSANGSPHALAKWANLCNFEGDVPLNTIPISVFCDLGSPLVDTF
ncbi:hypothetical protein CASFOL_017568 [Castilleja foliolosa]|uniref:RNase H type-1 domain-containing protein n=1 Tax=Castilleja foliolosa TaxID=1961234 RepID=A0ABD3D926_9LAMI